MWRYMLLFVLFFAGTLAFDPQFDIPDDWIDPTDMLTFDYASGTNKKRSIEDSTKETEDSKTTTAKEATIDEEKPVDRVSSNIEKQELKSKKENIKVTEPGNSECKHPFLRRFVGVLRSKLKHVGLPPSNEDYDFSIHLDSRNWLALEEFAEECSHNVQEVTRVLEDMIQDVHVALEDGNPKWIRKFEDFIRMPFEEFLKIGVCFALVVAVLTLEIVSKISWTTQIKRLIIVAFIISLGMTYIHEIKLAEAEHKSKSTDIPKECLGKEEDDSYWKSWMSVYNDMFSVKKDPCAEYHANFLISPHIKVTPTKVLAVTLTRFLVEPMEHIGTAFSKSFKNVFQGLPITLWIPAFIFVVLIILGFLLIISVFFGYTFSFNLPFWTGLQMGPQQNLQHNPQLDRVLEDNRRHIDQLQETIRELRERPQQQALPAPPQVSPSRARAILGYFGIGGRSSSPEPSQPPPPYPAHRRAPETDLPYPDFNAAPYPHDNDNIDPNGYRPFQSPYNPPRADRELRRRHTMPVSRERPESGDGNAEFTRARQKPRSSSQHELPYYRQPSSSTNEERRHVGFEHLIEEDEREMESKITPRVEEVPQKPVARSVERDATQTTSLCGISTTQPKVIEVIPKPLPSTVKPGNIDKIESSEASTPIPKDENPGARQKVEIESTLKTETEEPETLPVQEIGRNTDGKQSNAQGGDDNLDDWEEVSAEDELSNEKENCSGDKMDTLELMEVYKRVAEEGFSLQKNE